MFLIICLYLSVCKTRRLLTPSMVASDKTACLFLVLLLEVALHVLEQGLAPLMLRLLLKSYLMSNCVPCVLNLPNPQPSLHGKMEYEQRKKRKNKACLYLALSQGRGKSFWDGCYL